MLSFWQYIALQEGVVARHRMNPDELEKDDLIRLGASEGDIVELGAETQFKGEKVQKLGRIVQVKSSSVVVQPFIGDKPVVIPFTSLYEVPLVDIPPVFRRQLEELGNIKLFKKRTERQLQRDQSKKTKKEKEQAARLQSMLGSKPSFDSQKVQSNIDQLFDTKAKPKEDPKSVDAIMGNASKIGSSPLASRLNKPKLFDSETKAGTGRLISFDDLKLQRKRPARPNLNDIL